MSKTLLYEGPDLSYHNGNVNIKRIRDAGYGRVTLRIGYGKNNIDQKFIVNAQACYSLNVPVMLYWFSYAYTADMATAEAAYAIAQAVKYWKINCPIVFDFEYDSVNYARKNGISITKQLATDMSIAFLKTVKEAGHIPVIYTNKDYLKNYFDMDKITAVLGTVYVWYARYTNKLTDGETDTTDIWQYTASGVMDGVSGKVDINRFYTDFSAATVKADREDTCNINIRDFQAAANADGYKDANGNKLVEDGIDGTNTQYVRKQISLKAKKVGLTYKTSSTGSVVKWWQRRCNEILGHSQPIDGLYGKTARVETIELQKKLNLTADGIAGYNSLQAVFYS
jgi:GH25 family lysozyme M1 (1,4-beta-N-acetylmuramidase)